MAFDHVFSPLRIGDIEVPNRLFVSAHHTGFTTDVRHDLKEWSYLDARAAAYVEERARGGFGLIIVGQTQVHPRSGRHRPAAYGEEAWGAFADMAERCHRHGTRLFVQLNQNGNEQIWTGPDNWAPGWGASALATMDPASHGELSKEMDDEDMASLIRAFADAAAGVCRAGVDGVEIHAAHPHLLGQWLVPAYNKRRDGHGGSLNNRMRLVHAVIAAVRSACPRPFVVGLRTNGVWDMPGGQTLEDGVRIATMAAASGHLDFVNVSGWPGIGTIGTPPGAMVPSAAAVKAAVGPLPVFTIGRIVDPAQAEEILASRQADAVGMTRASIADPELPAKSRAGRLDEIRRCVGAGQGCLMRNAGGRPMTCTQNPAVGREAIWGAGTLMPAAHPRPVVVVGGGVAGMETAWVAAARGHRVTLLEEAPRLGGQVHLITSVSRRAEMAEVVRWRANQLVRLGVTVRCGERAGPSLGARLPPEAVLVVATGSRPRRAGWYAPLPHLDRIPGSDGLQVHTAWDVLQGALDGCGHVVVVDGCGYYQSSDPVERLGAVGVRISAVSSTPVFAEGLERNDRPAFAAAARAAGVTFYPSCVVTTIEPRAVHMLDTLHGRPVVIEDVDAVVLSLGNDVVDDLFHQFRAQNREVHRVGDCLAPRGIEHALVEAHGVARSL